MRWGKKVWLKFVPLLLELLQAHALARVDMPEEKRGKVTLQSWGVGEAYLSVERVSFQGLGKDKMFFLALNLEISCLTCLLEPYIPNY